MAQFLDKRDTDFVRNNMLLNYCLWDDERLLIESFIRNNKLDIRFRIHQFYFFMTGVHKKYVPRHTPDSFGTGVERALKIYALLEDALRACGYDGNAFLIKVDNSKQVGLLFSAVGPTQCTPEEMAQRLYTLYNTAEDPYYARQYTSTSFVGPFSGYEQIHTAFLRARALNDLLFFGVRDRVITEEYRAQTARPCDISAILANLRRLLHILCTGTQAQALRQADMMLSTLIAPSYSMNGFYEMFTVFEDMLCMMEAVYPVHIERRPLSSIHTLAAYQDDLHRVIRTLYAQLDGVRRYSPTILMTLSFINRNYTGELSLSMLSEYVYANPSSLSSDFNAEVGMSLSEYVTALRLRRAQELLQSSNASVSSIARQAGFASAKYFREIFKKQLGVSPQEYRLQKNSK